jgi:hypothetical protein
VDGHQFDGVAALALHLGIGFADLAGDQLGDIAQKLAQRGRAFFGKSIGHRHQLAEVGVFLLAHELSQHEVQVVRLS